jgi:hypothetical protein
MTSSRNYLYPILYGYIPAPAVPWVTLHTSPEMFRNTVSPLLIHRLCGPKIHGLYTWAQHEAPGLLSSFAPL